MLASFSRSGQPSLSRSRRRRCPGGARHRRRSSPTPTSSPWSLLVPDVGRTKIYWYLVPIYPFLSIAFAVAVERILVLTGRWGPRWWRTPSSARSMCAISSSARRWPACSSDALYYRFVQLPTREDIPQGRYGQVFAALDRAGITRIRTVDAGVYNNDEPGRLHAAAALLRPCLARARPRYRPRRSDQRRRPGQRSAVVTCDPNRLQMVQALGSSVIDIAGCAAVIGPPSGGR